MSPSSIRDTLPVDGSRLKEDRIAAGLSQEALLASCDKSFHIGTLRRAEHGENISKAYLESIAKALGYALDRYLKPAPPPPAAAPGIDISGTWSAFFVQDHAGTPPYIVHETTVFEQVGASLSGYAESDYRGKPIREIFSDLAIHGDMLMGHAIVEGWGNVTGATNIQAVISRGNDWIDGYTTWYDSDTRDICCSRYILIRQGASFEEDFKAEAEAIMAQERVAFSARR